MIDVTEKVESLLRGWKDRISCASRDCHDAHRTWKRFYDGTGSIQLHGVRFCFPDCFESELLRRFENLHHTPIVGTHAHHRVPLGLLMLSRGELDSMQLQMALAAQRRSGSGKIGEWITQMGFAREERIIAALAAQWSCPVLRSVPARTAGCEIPLELLRRNHMAPAYYARATGIVHIAFSESIDYRALLAVEQILRCKAEPCIASPSIVSILLARIEERHNRSDHSFENVQLVEEMTRITSSYASLLRTEDVRLTACGDFIWVRLDGNGNSTNLLFPRQAAEIAGGRLQPSYYKLANFQPPMAVTPHAEQIAGMPS